MSVVSTTGLAPDEYLPGEDPARLFPDDAAHWESVYRELVEFCRAEGIRHERFEARLTYWRRVLYGHPAASAHLVADPSPAQDPVA